MRFQFSWTYWHLLSSMWSLLKNVFYVLECVFCCFWRECFIHIYVYCVWSSTLSKAVSPYWFSVWMTCPWTEVGSPPIIVLLSASPFLPLNSSVQFSRSVVSDSAASWVAALDICCVCLGVPVLGAYVLRMLTSSWIDPFSVSYYSLCWKVCFVCSKRCCLSFLFISIFMGCPFPAPPFQSVSSDLKWVSVGTICIYGSCFFIRAAALCLFIRIVCPFTFKVVIDRSVLVAPWIVLLELLHSISAPFFFCSLALWFDGCLLWFDVWIPLSFLCMYLLLWGLWLPWGLYVTACVYTWSF